MLRKSIVIVKLLDRLIPSAQSLRGCSQTVNVSLVEVLTHLFWI